MSDLEQDWNAKQNWHIGLWTQNEKRRTTTQNFLIEVSYVKELRYIDPYCKVSVNRSLIVVPFENLFDRIYWCWEQTGHGGWKSLHTKIREHGYFINIELVRIFLSQSPTYQARIMKRTQKSLVTNPILSDEFGARAKLISLKWERIPMANIIGYLIIKTISLNG